MAALLVASTGCDGGGPSAPPQPSMSINFTASPSSPPANSITVSEVSKSATSITLAVNATGVTDLYGVGFELVWNPAFLSYQSATEGPFLRTGGAATLFGADLVDVAPGPAEDKRQGRLSVGVSRRGELPGASGSGQLLTITFTSVASGTTGLSFEATEAYNSAGVRITSVTFGGGSLSVRR